MDAARGTGAATTAAACARRRDLESAARGDPDAGMGSTMLKPRAAARGVAESAATVAFESATAEGRGWSGTSASNRTEKRRDACATTTTVAAAIGASVTATADMR